MPSVPAKLESSPGGEGKIEEFYRDKSILITGATGFLGKVLLEKLLRSCRGVKVIYVLIRSKKDKTPQQRLEQMISCQMLDAVRKECPESLKKIVPVPGDVSLPNLGISQEDCKLLTETVQIVFHCAATVRFDEPLKRAVQINLMGTKNILELCHSMSNLMAMVHVSTAYCFCNRIDIEEVVYPEEYDPYQVANATNWMKEDLLREATPYFTNGRPTTYHYVKALSENMLVEERGNIPTAIVRPSIVTASYKDPFPGWVDNYNGLSGFLVVAGKGVVRTMMVDNKGIADIVPVDTVANMMIAVAWHLGTARPDKVMVYNCTSGSLNKLTWGEIRKLCFPFVIKYPSKEVFRYPGGTFKSNKLWHWTSQQFEHFIPAYIVDFLAWATGNKPGMVKLYKKIHGAIGVLEYFTTREWVFHSDNVLKLNDQLSEEDKQEFDFDVRRIDWEAYMEDFVHGVRKYVLKEDDSTLPSARRKLNIVYYCWTAIYVALFAGAYTLLW